MVNRLVSVGDDNYLAPSVLVGPTNLPTGLTVAAIAGKVAKGELLINVQDYGANGNGATSNNTQIQAAVDAATAQGKALYWPTGTYVKSVNIANFHTVRHTGPGVIKHGTDLFYVEPKLGQSNTLYVSTSGTNSNDGTNSALPMRQVNYAFGTVLPNYGPVLDGVWTVKLAAGTYTDRVVFPTGLDSVNTVTIQGPIVGYPNNPTAKWSEGYNVSAAAIKMVDTKAAVTFSDIEFIGYNGSTASAGITTSGVEGSVTCINTWFTDCYWGFSNQDGDGFWVSGVANRCGFLGDTTTGTARSSRNGNGGAYRGLMHSRHTIGTQNAGDNSLGPKVTNSKSAFFIQELCTGHIDWATIEDCDFGVNLNVASRVNVDGTSFKRNSTDLKLLSNSHAYISANVQFGTGADESGIKVSAMGGSQVTDENRLFTNVLQGNATMMKIADTVFPARTIQATTTTTFYTATLAGNMWRDIPSSTNKVKRVNLRIYGELIGSAGNKQILVRLGSNLVTLLFTSADEGVFEADATVFFNGQTAQFMTIRGSRHLGPAVRLGSGAAANTLTTDTNLTAEASVSDAADSVIINAVDMSWG
ncbi:glycosyl hydrolase family 28-related protein [Arthrobacter sp. ok362]|uniref:glycosyl hydrolase family 28-related protein n=1 Tax=Arthrobacter sp. ok362 TaxID=1761745 RepID=UPI00088B91E0|nr:glycosyl hydrolase family 28-related protein [Arthrobacter sp. ok362]SDK78726.1 Pectate lyase superfamily protein [Arthrobacter sp. ok362]